MKILVLSNLYPPNTVGGYERLCCETTRALAARGHEIHVLTSTYGDGVPEFADHHVIRGLRLLADDRDIYRPFSPTPQEREAIERDNSEVLTRTVNQIKPDILFIWNLFFLDAALLQTILATPCPKVYLLTDNWLISFLRPEFWQAHFARQVMAVPTLFSRMRTVLAKFLLRLGPTRFSLPGTAVFPSVFMRELYAQAGFSFELSQIVPHGVTMPERRDEDFQDRSAPVVQDELRLLFAGRIVEVKGVHTAVVALPRIIAATPGVNVRLTILGDATDLEYSRGIHSMLQKSALSRHIDFQPLVPEKDLFNLFQRHDIYLFPSLYEPFSLTLIHALEAGIPTVASDIGGNPEIVHHGRTGLLFEKGNPADLADAVVRLHRTPNLRAELARQARTIAGNYTFEAMTSRIETILEQFACASP